MSDDDVVQQWECYCNKCGRQKVANADCTGEKCPYGQTGLEECDGTMVCRRVN